MIKMTNMRLLLFCAAVGMTVAFAPTNYINNNNNNRGYTASHVLFTTAPRKAYITGNWKLNPTTKQEAIDLAKGTADAISWKTTADVALFVPFPYLQGVKEAVQDRFKVGAQMVTPEDGGAFTAGISPQMLKSIGVNDVLVGHSERRELYHETDEYINRQCLKLVENDMNIVLCIGESLLEFDKDLVGAICEIQLKKALNGISAERMSARVTIAYEPIWAIGTGKVATPEIAQSVHATIRRIIANMYNPIVADRTRILYGGSVSPESVDGLMAQPDIDGTLVGGASLDFSKFGRIINYQQVKEPVPV